MPIRACWDAAATSVFGGLRLRRRARMTGSSDILGFDKGCLVSPAGALVIDDGGHVRIRQLWTEGGHRGRICHARDCPPWAPLRTVFRCSDGSFAFAVALPASGGNTPGRPRPVS